jgi:hypothetical protein
VFTKPGAIRAIMDKLENSSNIEMYRTRLSNIAGMLDIPSKLLDNINTEDFAKAIDKFKEVTQADISLTTVARIGNMVPGSRTLDWKIRCMLSRIVEASMELGMPNTSTTGEIVEAIRELKSDLGNCKTSIASSEESDKQIATCLGIDYATSGTSDYIDAIENLQKGSNTYGISKETLSNVAKLFPHPNVTDFDDRINRMFLRIEAVCLNLGIGTDSGVLDIQRAIIAMKKESKSKPINLNTVVLQEHILEQLKRMSKKTHKGSAIEVSTQVEVVCKRLELLCTHLTISDSSSFADIAQAIEDSKVITPVTDSNDKSEDTPELIKLRKIEDKYIKLALWVADALAEED